jgi:hypothetical protein
LPRRRTRGGFTNLAVGPNLDALKFGYFGTYNRKTDVFSLTCT